MTPYYEDERVTLYHGDCREVLPELGLQVDAIVTDPPYGETSLAWDRWPDGWPALVADASSSMWCFGSFRMFLERRDEFAGWRLSQDVVWEKHTGTSMAADRFRRVHEHALHWYRGPWTDLHHDTPRVPRTGPHVAHAVREPVKDARWQGARGASTWEDDGTRLHPSIVRARTMHRNGGIHPTEKPVAVLVPLIQYACPPGGTVLDPFAGSGSTLRAAADLGRKAVGVEVAERYCKAIVRRMAQQTLGIGEPA